MKQINVDLDLDCLDLHIFGDIHVGSKKCNYDLVKARINAVKDNPKARAIILGDLLNNSTKTSVGDVYSEPLSPMEQIKTAVNLFEPIKDKIIAVVSGNHERRSYKTDGLDLIHFFCAELGIAEIYDYTSCLLFLHWNGANGNGKGVIKTVYLTHGDGNGGRLVGGKANGMSRRGQIVDADVMITGHTHQPIVFSEAHYRCDTNHRTVRKIDQLYVNIGATLDYEEYAELFGMAPSSKRNPIVYFNQDGSVTATL